MGNPQQKSRSELHASAQPRDHADVDGVGLRDLGQGLARGAALERFFALVVGKLRLAAELHAFRCGIRGEAASDAMLRRQNISSPSAILSGMSASSTGEKRAMNILRELHAAEKELVGRAVVLTDGKAGTIDHVFLDDEHGLRISIRGHAGRWPISTVKHIES
jgi:hypothetical protein